MKINVGDKAPDFTLPSQMGDNVTLSEYFDKKNVVLYFYPKDETRGCTREACEFRDSYDVFTSLGAEVLGVSSDTLESHKSFATHHGLPFLLLSDEKGSQKALRRALNHGRDPWASILHNRQERHRPPRIQFPVST
jgi:peroxiredoxin Q/BCP